MIKPCCHSRGRLYKMYGINKFKAPDANQSALSATQLSGADDASWAVVTGGSDGLGLAICKKLAREGYNICIVSRTASKINEKLDEVRTECRQGDTSFKTLCVVADFGKLHTIEDYRAAIGEKVKDLDIGILVLNAGFVMWGPIAEIRDSDVEGQLTINMLQVTYTTKVLIKQMIDRFHAKGKKSAILITSSIIANLATPTMAIYAATKGFATMFG